ncbi:hypothetical protein EJ05DRAFT_459204 [Pseudovirgaria hyperparasitica]|uniref:Multicopper oxidase n=1 Tax=Pseudovirgaria hyperparasitica TaxID=470096 RepID=A0A6A6WI02_9PEZI|nr:uncharacterized protein EJ05DRAFT_459204 [Pseudovirgaria hyperparasitica]KAF2762432.1 hypothetical protein EJ05DRAFT_459204 [Pseudovirgaria hyperparasitica]
MKLNAVWTTIVYYFDIFSLGSSPGDGQAPLQQLVEPHIKPAIVRPPHPHFKPLDVEVITLDSDEGRDDSKIYMLQDGTPVVIAPKHADEGPSHLKCQYPSLKDKGFKSCYTPQSRNCWLRNDAGFEYGIDTDYEDESEIPTGILRKFILDVGEQPISPDRMTLEFGKVFNRTYPGPWIEACWGDTIEVEVRNGLRWNGTSVHWHGFRQLRNSHMDGVNGITECPIAPGDSFTYRFKAMQYGSAWYHSHYSLQYGDGMLGPITIYGPSTADFDEDQSFRPILMTDWNHRSVFEDWPNLLVKGTAPEMTNILLNGTGQFGPGSKVEDKYQLNFTAGTTHKLILINTAVDTAFSFSIDHHNFTVIEADFVPIKPYTTDNIKVGIGQRYHIIVKGHDKPYEKERAGNYWIRTIPLRKCSKFAFGPDEQSGIIRYNPKESRNTISFSEPEGGIDTSCADEHKDKLVPWHEWQVKDPVNIKPGMDLATLPNHKQYKFDVGISKSSGPPYVPEEELSRWAMHTAPFRINFSEPTILQLDKYDSIIDRPYLDIITIDEEESDQWIWMVITGYAIPSGGGERSFFPAAHPMHLHGHDFAVLFQTDHPWDDDDSSPGGKIPGWGERFTPEKMNCDNEYIDCNNPARRDVILLPAGGFVIIAFKADNPGTWIFHCHIAFHASSGLAIQIIENRHKIHETFAKDEADIRERCENWDEWFSNPMNLWDYQHPKHFQDDSGV